MKDQRILDLLIEHSGLRDLEQIDAAHVTEFRGTRRNVDGTSKAVTVKIHDYGHGHGSRYFCVAEDEDGRVTSGNAEKDLETCLACVLLARLDVGGPVTQPGYGPVVGAEGL